MAVGLLKWSSTYQPCVSKDADNQPREFEEAVMSQGKRLIAGTNTLVGKASIEIEMTDSQTGELIAAAVNRRGGGKYAWKPLNRWEDFEQAATYWAKKFR
jgi:hypothetical protein